MTEEPGIRNCTVSQFCLAVWNYMDK